MMMAQILTKGLRFLTTSLSSRAWLWAVLAVIVLRLPTLWDAGGYGDEGIYMAVARSMHQGSQLYTQIWDHKPPALYWLYYLAYFLPDWRWAFVALKVVGIVLATGVVALYVGLGRRFELTKSWWWPLSLGLVILVFSSILLESQTINAELVFIPINLLIAWLLLSARQRQRQRWWLWMLAGFLLAWSLLIKFNGGLEAMVLVGSIAICAGGHLSDLIRRGAAVVGGAASVLLPWLAWVLWQGDVAEVWYAVWTYNLKYSAWAWPKLHLFGAEVSMSKIWALAGLLVILALWGWLWRQRQRLSDEAKKIILLAIWLIIVVVSAGLSGRPYGHYYLQVIIPFLLVLVWWLNRLHLFELQRPWRVGLSGVAWLVMGWAMLVFAAWPTDGWISQRIYDNRVSRVDYLASSDRPGAAHWLDSQLESSDRYYFYGNSAWTLVWTRNMFTNIYLVDYHRKYPDPGIVEPIEKSNAVVVDSRARESGRMVADLRKDGWQQTSSWRTYLLFMRSN